MLKALGTIWWMGHLVQADRRTGRIPIDFMIGALMAGLISNLLTP